jgi:twitching motility protein PilT
MGLRAALRQDPDVILIGEMRDTETIDTAMKAAETGHLLISTLHTPDAQTTIMRIVAMFPPDEQTVVRIRLAETLHAVVSQRLLPRANGQGRVVAAEIMVVTPTIRDLIIENRISEIRDYITDGSQYGMQTFDQHLTELVTSGEVAFEAALAAATRPADFELGFRMGKGRKTPLGNRAVGGRAPGAGASPPLAKSAPGSAGNPSAGLGLNPLGTGASLPPIATSPSSHSAVTSPNPLGNDAVFGSGFESLFGG